MKIALKHTVILFILVLINKGLLAYTNGGDTNDVHMGISFAYGFNAPILDMGERFFTYSTIGGKLDVKTANNWLWQLGGSFMFKDTVKQTDILDNLINDNGFIITGEGEIANVLLWQRGFNVELMTGKILNFKNTNGSGISFSGGLGFMQHKILLYSKDFVIPQVQREYVKGYDRLTNGLYAKESIKFRHFPSGRMVGFFAGLDMVQGFTKNRRSYNFSTMMKEDDLRMDFSFGLEVGITILFKRKSPDEYYFY